VNYFLIPGYTCNIAKVQFLTSGFFAVYFIEESQNVKIILVCLKVTIEKDDG
jgi:hypothetical protein